MRTERFQAPALPNQQLLCLRFSADYRLKETAIGSLKLADLINPSIFTKVDNIKYLGFAPRGG